MHGPMNVTFYYLLPAPTVTVLLVLVNFNNSNEGKTATVPTLKFSPDCL